LTVRLFLTTDEGIKEGITADNTIELSFTGNFSDDSGNGDTTFAGSDTVRILTYNEKQVSKGK
jgi:hypothetical protein